MRIRVILQADRPIWVPWHYPEWLQGVIYEALKRSAPKLASYLHSEGFKVGSRRYKLMTFSWLFARSTTRHDTGLSLGPPIKWWISSPLKAVIEALAEALLTHPEVTLGREKVCVEKVLVEPPFQPMAPVLLETLSPIVVSTGTVEKGNMRKIFLSPEDERFSEVITENLQNKSKAFSGAEVPGGRVTLLPLKYRSRLVTIHGTKVKCYEGIFKANGDLELIKLGYEAGFGERNSQGFGMMKTVNFRSP